MCSSPSRETGGPAAAAAWSELRRAPDFTIVEVTGPDGDVRIQKLGDRLVVHVDESGTRADVTVPLGTVDVLLAKLR